MPAISEARQVGKREDLSDMLVVASAKDTPVTSMMAKGTKPTNALFGWPVDNQAKPDTDGVADGDPASDFDDLSARAILQGRVQKFRSNPAVSELAEEVSTPAGVASEFARAKAKSLEKVKFSIEARFCSDGDSSKVGTTNQTRGLGSWISNSAQSDLPVDENYRTPTASIYSSGLSSLLESNLLSVMQSIYEQTGRKGNWDCPFGTALKALVSTFSVHDPNVSSTTVIRRFNSTQGEDYKLETKVDIIQGDFGTLRLFPTLFNGWNNTTKAPDSKRGYVLDMADLKMRANKAPGFKPLPDDDSGPRGVVSAIVALMVGNPLKHGKIAAT